MCEFVFWARKKVLGNDLTLAMSLDRAGNETGAHFFLMPIGIEARHISYASTAVWKDIEGIPYGCYT